VDAWLANIIPTSITCRHCFVCSARPFGSGVVPKITTLGSPTLECGYFWNILALGPHPTHYCNNVCSWRVISYICNYLQLLNRIHCHIASLTVPFSGSAIIKLFYKIAKNLEIFF
jgi:hypothetical protein